MEDRTLNVLLIEDSEVYRTLIQRHLEEAAPESILLHWAENLETGLRRLSRGDIDAVLLDLILPDSGGIDTLWKTLVHSPDVAVVVLTALDDEDLALKAVKGGAQDYLGKEGLSGAALVRSLRRAVERKQLVTRLEKSVERLEHSHQDLSQFAAAAADVLKPLLETVSGTCHYFLTEGATLLDEEARSRVLCAHEGLERLAKIFDGFITYVQVVVHKPPPDARADAEAVLKDALSRLEAEIRSSGASITHDRLPEVAVEPSCLRGLFENLIGNAIEYRREEPPSLHIGVRKEGAWWAFSLRDNGLGIDPEYPEQIFDLFTQLGSSKTRRRRGTGLAISKSIVEGSGGRIWVESEVGRGSVFQFTLPSVMEKRGGSHREGES